MLYIRTDGNTTIGIGHVMRCLSIADGLKKLGQDTVFIVADVNPVNLINSRGYRSIVIESDYRHTKKEIKRLIQCIKEEDISFLLADSYFMSYEYFMELSHYVKIGYLDDFGKEAYPVEVLINYNIYGTRLPYKKLYEENGKKVDFLLGSTYAPLRSDFSYVPYQVRKCAKNVLVTTGGADAYNVAGQFLEKMTEEDGETTFHVISGPFHTFRSQLEEMSKVHENIAIHENVTRMAQQMQECDLAVSAAGSTLYELCAVTVPTVYFYFVQNQELPSKYFERDTKMINAGNYVTKPEETLQKLVDNTKKLLHSYELRSEISQSMSKITDGSGAERIAKCLKAYLL